MDQGIVDTINRRDVTIITARLDALDLPKYRSTHGPWYLGPMADILMSEDDATRSQRAWIVGQIAVNARGIAFDGDAAGGDWDNLFSHLRDAIATRRDPETPQGEAAEFRHAVVV
jgi:hypothetical protein